MPPSGTAPKAREPLSRPRIIAAAIALADREGLEAISMRRVGDALDVEAMSLYRYVEGKGDLVDAMVDGVIAEFPPADVGLDWSSRLRTLVLGAYLVLVDHGWAAAPASSRRSSGPARRAYTGALIDALRAGGCGDRVAHDAAHALDNQVFGFALQETRHETVDGRAERDAEFVFVLDLLIAGLETTTARPELTSAG